MPWLAAPLLLVLLACTAPESAATSAASEPGSRSEALDELVELTRGGAETTEVTARGTEESPLWPQLLFLRAERLLASGDAPSAREHHAELARWAAGDPYEDGLGGSVLGFVGLWRWAQALAGPDAPTGAALKAEIEEAADLHDRLAGSHFAQRLARFAFLDALPQIRIDAARSLATAAWRAGDRATAERLFLAYLELGPRTESSLEEKSLLDSLLAAGGLSEVRVTELQAKRLERLRKLEEALPLWQRVLEKGDSGQRDSARLAIARLKSRLFAGDRGEIAGYLTAVIDGASDPEIVQQALLSRASTWSREGSGQRIERFLADLRRAIDSYPTGTRTDDALYRLASHYQRRYASTRQADDLDRSLGYYRQLRDFAGANDWEDSAHFQPAVMHYARGGRQNLVNALDLLRQLEKKDPDGPLRRHSQFWQARVLEDLEEAEAANEAFERLVRERPYDYHGIRARMHLSLGPSARGTLWPDARTRSALKRDHDGAEASLPLTGTTPYHRRLEAAIDSGLYARWVGERNALREAFPGDRIQSLALEQLDEGRSLAPLVLFLALRQDALAAASRAEDGADALAVHAAVGLGAGDLPLAMSMAMGSLGTDAKGNSRFLRTAYPVAYPKAYAAASRAEGVPPQLLYALSRRESLFDPAAISTFSALGLFQFIPSTFEALDERWSLLARSDYDQREPYLMDASLSASLGARWLSDELIFRQNCVLIKELGQSCNATTRADPRLALILDGAWFDVEASTRQQRVVLLALMEHSRGYRAVRGWLDTWNREGRGEDLEYMIETAGAAETRILVRGVLTDAAIAASIGLFGEPTSTASPSRP